MLSKMILCAGLCSVVLASQEASAQPTKLRRTVQVISMAQPTQEGQAGNLAGAAGEPAPPPTQPFPLTPAFKAHDLSRRWVEFQMASSFAEEAPAGSSSSAREPASIGTIAAAAPAGTPAVSYIPIPAWMRGGATYSAGITTFAPGCGVGVYRPAGFLTPDAELRRQSYYSMMSNIACQYGIPIGLFDAMIIRESQYKAGVFSPKRAFGLTQLMPDTAAAMGVDRYDTEQNLRGGARYLRQQLDRFGQIHLALAAYNAGPGRVRGGVVPQIAETQSYVENVLLNWRRLAGLGVGPAIAPGAPAISAARSERATRITTVTTY